MFISEAKSRVTNYHTSDWRQEILQEKCMISANSFLPKPCIRHHKMPTSTMQYQYIVQTLKNKKWNRDYQSNIQESTELFHSRKVWTEASDAIYYWNIAANSYTKPCISIRDACLLSSFNSRLGHKEDVTDYQINQQESISLCQNNGTDPRTNISPFLGQILKYRCLVHQMGTEITALNNRNPS